MMFKNRNVEGMTYAVIFGGILYAFLCLIEWACPSLLQVR